MIHNQTFDLIINVTLPTTKANECLAFCQDQAVIHAQNIQTEGIFLAYISAILFLAHRIFANSQHQRIKNVSFDGGIIFLMGFLIWHILTL